MYILKYFDGSELKLNCTTFSFAKKAAEENPNVYQILRNNRNKSVVWERECEEF